MIFIKMIQKILIFILLTCSISYVIKRVFYSKKKECNKCQKEIK